MSDILLITNKGDITTDFIVKKLKLVNASFYRLNTEDIGGHIQILFDFTNETYTLIDLNQKITIDLLKVRSVYFRRPEIHFNSAELTLGENNFIRAELLYTLEGLYRILEGAYWISNVFAIRNAENKIYQLLLAKQIGLKIPDSIITNTPQAGKQFYHDSDQSCIIKPVKCGLVEGENEEGVIFTSRVEINESNSERISSCPVYLQKLIPKKADVRVTVVGKKLFPALIHSQDREESQVDWRKTDQMLQYSKIELPEEVAGRCRELLNLLDLDFAAIDFILNEDGSYTFLEINPNGQWAWIEKQLKYNLSDEIVSLLVEA